MSKRRRRHTIQRGDCLTLMNRLDADSVDAIVTDPPYGLGFMGQKWDACVPGVEYWQAALRVAKPGAHLLAFGGTRIFHRLACAIEDAGWELRDCIMWVYNNGFPKSLDISKAIDKRAGYWRGRAGRVRGTSVAMSGPNYEKTDKGHAICAAAAAAAGWGTALKPAWEPILVCRKPLVGTVAENVEQFGTGGLNIDATRISFASNADRASVLARPASLAPYCRDKGRWPANLIHDGRDESLAIFPGGAGRFYYCAKASKRDRDDGCQDIAPKANDFQRPSSGLAMSSNDKKGKRATNSRPRHNSHPTVKPTSLMRYLCRLVTPPDGLILDPFAGSGSTGKAAVLERFRFLGMERDQAFAAIARSRINYARAQEAG